MQEEWKVFDDLEGVYSVSNFGKVKNNKTNRMLTISEGDRGYLRCSLWDKKTNKIRTTRMNRLVAIVFIDNPNGYPNVNHKDGNKKNNRVDNLEWCTQKYNVNHALEMNLRKTKITRQAVKEIEDLQYKIERKNIAKMYGITKERVSAIWYERNKREGKSRKEIIDNMTLYPTNNKGEKHRNSKLDDEKVKEIKAWLRQKKSLSKIAKMFNVSKTTISKIKNGLSWGHIN